VHRGEFEREVAEACQAYGIGVITYSPLAGGFLTGKSRKDQAEPESARLGGIRQRYFNERGWAILEAVELVAKENSLAVSQVALGWLLSDPLITSPIIGPRDMEQLNDNLSAVGVRLAAEQKKRLDDASDWHVES
jgi:aryl-alcohol dehydrogenase-like predicted oxidoreductase